MVELKPEKIKVVSFDAADTLFYIKNGLGAAYAEKAEKYGVRPQPEKIKRAFSRAFRSAPPLAFGKCGENEKKRLEKQWWKNVVRNVFEETGMFAGFDACFEDLFDHFQNRAWVAFPDSVPTLLELRQMGYGIMLISNFDSRVYTVLENLNLKQFFSSFTISSEAGFAKPSPEIFRIALEKQGAKPHECVHIGDDMENDCIGAENAGIKAVLLNRKNGTNGGGVLSVQTLAEIPALLGAKTGKAGR